MSSPNPVSSWTLTGSLNSCNRFAYKHAYEAYAAVRWTVEHRPWATKTRLHCLYE